MKTQLHNGEARRGTSGGSAAVTAQTIGGYCRTNTRPSVMRLKSVLTKAVQLSIFFYLSGTPRHATAMSRL